MSKEPEKKEAEQVKAKPVPEKKTEESPPEDKSKSSPKKKKGTEVRFILAGMHHVPFYA